jgi:hypothetical protein
MRVFLGHLRNVALIAFAMTLLSAGEARAEHCYTSPSGTCVCCDGDGGSCCLIVCGTNWCDCCHGSCEGPGCGAG